MDLDFHYINLVQVSLSQSTIVKNISTHNNDIKRFSIHVGNLLPFGVDNGDYALHVTDDNSSGPLAKTPACPLFGTNETVLYVSSLMGSRTWSVHSLVQMRKQYNVRQQGLLNSAYACKDSKC